MEKLDLRLIACSLLITLSQVSWAASDSAANPADELADLINAKRTAGKLEENAGLACIALQYVHEYAEECDQVGKARPPDSLLNSTFAAACGVAPSSVVTPLAGALLYCQSSYVQAPQALQLLLGSNSSKSLAIINNANHTQLGVAVGSYAGGSPFYWAALFSDAPPNSTFLFSDGKPLMQHEGCFSGLGQPCSSHASRSSPPTLSILICILLLLASL